MFLEDDLLPISALQHLEFCERQWALIHLEQVWSENTLTAEGRVLHERCDGSEYETRNGVRTSRSLPIRSMRLGLTGKADVVEFHEDASSVMPTETGCTAPLPGFASGHWLAYPIEFKRGRPKHDSCDEVQLCAQALCLEEMLGVRVPDGALYYGQTRHRHEVVFTQQLRSHTEELAARLHELWEARVTPRAEYGPKCRNCSLVDLCLPQALGRRRRVNDYLLKPLGPAPGGADIPEE